MKRIKTSAKSAGQRFYRVQAATTADVAVVMLVNLLSLVPDVPIVGAGNFISMVLPAAEFIEKPYNK